MNVFETVSPVQVSPAPEPIYQAIAVTVTWPETTHICYVIDTGELGTFPWTCDACAAMNIITSGQEVVLSPGSYLHLMGCDVINRAYNEVKIYRDGLLLIFA